MSSPNLRHSYEILDISSSSTWAEVRNAYRKLVQQWYLDRFSDAARADAERKLTEINLAFSGIEKYYRKYGRLPDSPREAVEVAPQYQSSMGSGVNTRQDSWTQTSKPEQTPTPTPLKPQVLFALACVVVYFFWFAFWPAPEQGAPDSVFSTSVTKDASAEAQTVIIETPRVRPFLKRGLTETEVYGIQGKPGSIKDSLWYYGQSVVFFKNGKVIGWHENPEFPLQTEARIRQANQSARENQP